MLRRANCSTIDTATGVALSVECHVPLTIWFAFQTLGETRRATPLGAKALATYTTAPVATGPEATVSFTRELGVAACRILAASWHSEGVHLKRARTEPQKQKLLHPEAFLLLKRQREEETC